MKEKLIALLEVYKTSIQQIELRINNGDDTLGTEYRLSIEKKCYTIFVEQLESAINNENI